MHSRVKLIPPEQVEDDGLNVVSKERKISDNRKKKDNSKGKSFRVSSSDDDELGKIKKHSRKRMWYSSEELSSTESDKDEKKQRGKRETGFRSGKEEYTSEKGFPASASDGRDGNRKDNVKGEVTDIAIKGMGLDSMLRSESKKPPVSETKEILVEEVPVEEEVFEAHMTQYCEVSGGKSEDQVLGSGSFDTSYSDSSPSSFGSTARSVRPSAEQSHLVQDLRRQLSELKHQQILEQHRHQQKMQELREEWKRIEERGQQMWEEVGKRIEERWQQISAMHQQQQQPHPPIPPPLFYPPPLYQHYVAFQPGAYMPQPWYQQQPQPFIPPPLFYPPPPYQHYVSFQQGAYMPPPSHQQQYDTNQSGGVSHTSMPNYFLSPPQVFPGTPAVVNQPPT